MKINSSISYHSPQHLASLPQNSAVLLAFSGGADSSALLSILAKDAKINGYSLHIAHFHHGIRGEEANRDAEFCEREARRYGLPFHLGCADVPALAKANKNSLENEARIQRYAFFEKVMRKNNISILATAHHSEDQSESILLHILRGSGIGGLKGMQKCRSLFGDLYLVRPLLEVKKQDILNYCKENNINFVCDSTNDDTSYLRNSIRANIIPKLYEIQPNFTEVFQRLSENALEADDFINSSALHFINNECECAIPLEKFNELHKALKSRVLAIYFEKEYGSTLEKVHIEDIITLCIKSQAHSSISLPNKISAKIENGMLIFDNDEKTNNDFDFNIAFCEGELKILDHTIITVVKNPKENENADQIHFDINCDLIKSDAHFRSKLDGDTIFLNKMHKKAKKLMSDKKIPLNMRKKLPILVSQNEILWIPLVAVSDKAKNNKQEKGEDFYRISIKFVN